MEKEIIREIDVQNVMTKSSLPVGGFSVNPYVGCPHACKYCYASFMKRFTGHTEPWGTFLDVKLLIIRINMMDNGLLSVL